MRILDRIPDRILFSTLFVIAFACLCAGGMLVGWAFYWAGKILE